MRVSQQSVHVLRVTHAHGIGRDLRLNDEVMLAAPRALVIDLHELGATGASHLTTHAALPAAA
jgi:hypothetical protein